TYFAFLDHHGMLRPVRPLEWRTIAGGSRRYVDALVARLHARGRFALHLATPVARIERDAHGVTLAVAGGERRYDAAIVATHADPRPPRDHVRTSAIRSRRARRASRAAAAGGRRAHVLRRRALRLRLSRGRDALRARRRGARARRRRAGCGMTFRSALYRGEL